MPWVATLTQVLEDRARGQVARRAGHRAARMGARAAQVQAVDAGEAARREAALQQLVAEHLAVEDVPAGQAEARLELAGPQREALDDAVGQARAGLGEARDRGV